MPVVLAPFGKWANVDGYQLATDQLTVPRPDLITWLHDVLQFMVYAYTDDGMTSPLGFNSFIHREGHPMIGIGFVDVPTGSVICRHLILAGHCCVDLILQPL